MSDMTLPERLKALGERLADAIRDDGWPLAREELVATMDRILPAELLTALENDARYRWLRQDRDVNSNMNGVPFVGRCWNGAFTRWTEDEADAAIDAAIDAARPTACATDGGGNGN